MDWLSASRQSGLENVQQHGFKHRFNSGVYQRLSPLIIDELIQEITCDIWFLGISIEYNFLKYDFFNIDIIYQINQKNTRSISETLYTRIEYNFCTSLKLLFKLLTINRFMNHYSKI